MTKTKKPGRPKKRRISAQHKQAISEAQKARWAKRKAAKAESHRQHSGLIARIRRLFK